MTAMFTAFTRTAISPKLRFQYVKLNILFFDKENITRHKLFQQDNICPKNYSSFYTKYIEIQVNNNFILICGYK